MGPQWSGQCLVQRLSERRQWWGGPGLGGGRASGVVEVTAVSIGISTVVGACRRAWVLFLDRGLGACKERLP